MRKPDNRYYRVRRGAQDRTYMFLRSDDMKVKYTRSDREDPNLTYNNIYFVVGIEFSSKYQEPSQYIQFRVVDDDMHVSLCKAKDFEIVECEIAANWVFVNRKENSYSIVPKRISHNLFWEEYYNDNEYAVKALDEVYIELIGRYCSEYELTEMINSRNIVKSSNAIRSLKFRPDNLFDEIIINRIEAEMRTLKEYSYPQINQVVLEGYEYLSHRTGNPVEKLFTSYYEHTDLHCDRLDEIVNYYFTKNNYGTGE